jgi:CheY-like chemotaxis protein
MEKILIIDDNQLVLEIMDMILRRSGYDVTMAHDGNEGIELLKTNNDFRAVITDIRMPGSDGNQVAEYIRRNENLQNTPIVAITAFQNEAKFELFDSLLTKPFEMKDLIKTVYSLLAD